MWVVQLSCNEGIPREILHSEFCVHAAVRGHSGVGLRVVGSGQSDLANARRIGAGPGEFMV